MAVPADPGGLVLPFGLGLEDADQQHLLVHGEQVGVWGNGHGSGLLEETGVLRADARHLLQDVAQVIAQQRLGAVAVVVGDGRDHPPVLLDHLREIAGHGHAQPAYPVQVPARAG